MDLHRILFRMASLPERRGLTSELGLAHIACLRMRAMRAGRTHAQHGGTDLPGFSLGNEGDEEGGQKTNRGGDPKFHKRRRTRRNFVLRKSDVLKYGDAEP